jgi:hypothetical protein
MRNARVGAEHPPTTTRPPLPLLSHPPNVGRCTAMPRASSDASTQTIGICRGVCVCVCVCVCAPDPSTPSSPSASTSAIHHHHQPPERPPTSISCSTGISPSLHRPAPQPRPQLALRASPTPSTHTNAHLDLVQHRQQPLPPQARLQPLPQLARQARELARVLLPLPAPLAARNPAAPRRRAREVAAAAAAPACAAAAAALAPACSLHPACSGAALPPAPLPCCVCTPRLNSTSVYEVPGGGGGGTGDARSPLSASLTAATPPGRLLSSFCGRVGECA